MRNKLFVLAVPLLVAVAASPAIAADKTKLRIQNHQSNESPQGTLIAKFVEDVATVLPLITGLLKNVENSAKRLRKHEIIRLKKHRKLGLWSKVAERFSNVWVCS